MSGGHINSLSAALLSHPSSLLLPHRPAAGGFFFGYALSRALGLPERAARTNSIEVGWLWLPPAAAFPSYLWCLCCFSCLHCCCEHVSGDKHARICRVYGVGVGHALSELWGQFLVWRGAALLLHA